MRISVITSNSGKFGEIKNYFANSYPQANIVQKNIELVEIQGSPAEIIKYKCEQIISAGELDDFNIVEDISLEIAALGGMPGPYIKHFLASMKVADIYNMLSTFADKTAIEICKMALIYADGSYTVVDGIVPGTIVPPKGESGFGFDSIFIPHGANQTYAEMAPSDREAAKSRAAALRLLEKYLAKL